MILKLSDILGSRGPSKFEKELADSVGCSPQMLRYYAARLALEFAKHDRLTREEGQLLARRAQSSLNQKKAVRLNFKNPWWTGPYAFNWLFSRD